MNNNQGLELFLSELLKDKYSQSLKTMFIEEDTLIAWSIDKPTYSVMYVNNTKGEWISYYKNGVETSYEIIDDKLKFNRQFYLK